MSQNLEIALFPCLSDNYGFLIHDPESGETAAIDTPEASKIEAACAERGWTLTQIWNTHHHPDHVGGNLVLQERYGLDIFGPDQIKGRIPGLTRGVLFTMSHPPKPFSWVILFLCSAAGDYLKVHPKICLAPWQQ